MKVMVMQAKRAQPGNSQSNGCLAQPWFMGFMVTNKGQDTTWGGMGKSYLQRSISRAVFPQAELFLGLEDDLVSTRIPR